MRMRDADNAVVDVVKLQLYCMDRGHSRGTHLARQFEERLGFTGRDAEELREQLLKAILKSEDAQPIERDDYGQRYILDVDVTGPKGEATVRTIWIAREGERGPRLLTCHVREEAPHATREVA